MIKLLVLLSLPALIASRLLLRPIGFEFKSKSTRKDGCNFGLRHYKIGSTWHPELVPFGVLRCVLCSCVKHPKKPGNYGKLSCRNTRHRCPRSACTNPIYKANQCCPTCPPEFVAVLHPPQSSSFKPTGLARAHLTVVKSAVHISIRYRGNQRPKTLIFMGPRDNKIHELNIHRKFVNGSKVCLLWRGIGDKELIHLNNGRVTALLKFRRKNTGILKGAVSLYQAYSEEAFEALLEPTLRKDAHIVALASLTISRNGKTLHVKLRNSELTHVDGKAMFATIQFIKSTHRGRAQVLRTLSVSLKAQGGHGKTAWIEPSEQNLKWMARGILNMTLAITAGGYTVTMKGRIGIKRSCNTIYAAMAGREGSRPTITGASGYTSFEFNNEGQIHYKIVLSGLMQPVMEIKMEMSRKRVVKRISRSVNPTSDSRVQVEGVWARPSVSEICALFSGGMTVVVRTALYLRGELRGFVRQLPYGGHHLPFQGTPLLLSGNDVVPSTQTGAAGLAWVSLDRHCTLHYHVLVIGINRGRQNTVTADLEGFAIAGELPLEFEKQKYTLSAFHTGMISGAVRDLNTDFLHNIFQGQVYMQISSTDNPRGELRAQLTLDEADQCRNKLPPQKTDYTIEGSCVSASGERFFNGEAWSPDYDSKCNTCSCKDTKISCFPVVCLPTNCSEALVMMPDTCCPVCPVMEHEAIRSYKGVSPPRDKGCFIDQGKKFYPSGAVWHPYVQPFGYMKCVVCTCLMHSNEINCNKVQCPRLTCANPTKLHNSDCCARCPVQSKPGKDLAPLACKFGQNTYPNGARWTPFLPGFGLLKCVSCKCENGKSNCSTVTCPKNHCKTSIGSSSKSCCAPCSGSK